METRVVTTASRPDLDCQTPELAGGFPEFVLHDRQAETAMPQAWQVFPRFDLRLVAGSADGSSAGDTVVAGGWGVPLRWDGEPGTLPDGYDGALTAALAGHDSGTEPDTLCLMAAAVRAGHQGAGLAGAVLTALRERAAAAGIGKVIAPVRPTLKARYPLTPMDRFAGWTGDDGLHLDPWIRAHQRLGATILAPAPRSMIVAGTVAQWQDWTQMAFPDSGPYVVPGALDLVTIDVAGDCGRYEETNLWMRHA